MKPLNSRDLTRAICEEFAPRFLHPVQVAFVAEEECMDEGLLSSLGVGMKSHSSISDLVLYEHDRKRIVIADAVTSVHRPIGEERRKALLRTFSGSSAGLIFLIAFPDRDIFSRYAEFIPWETVVWTASDPAHLIHFNGARLLGPYPHPETR
jgi:hypothetical protein